MDSTVQQSGGDFTTLAAALADAGTVDGDTVTIQGPWTIDDTASWTMDDDDLTARTIGSNTSYHDGVYSESNQHYRNVVADGNHCGTVNNTGCTVDGLAIVQAGSGASDEGIRFASANSILNVKNSLIIAFPSDISEQDGIYCSEDGTILNVDNNILYGWGRAGLHGQLLGVHVQTWNINSHTLWHNGTQAGAESGGIVMRRLSSTPTYTVNIFNTIAVLNTDENADYFDDGVEGSSTWTIGNSMASDGSITDRDAGAVGALENRTPTDNPSPGVGDFVIFRDITNEATYNLLLVNNALDNDAQDAHSNTSGAGMNLPTLDITNEIRDRASGKIDIGADAFPAIAAVPTFGQRFFVGQGKGDRPSFGQPISRATG